MSADERKGTYSSIFWTISKRTTHFHNSIITENEIRIHRNTPESKRKGVIVIYCENKVQSDVIRGNIMVTVFFLFFYWKGLLNVEFTPKWTTVKITKGDSKIKGLAFKKKIILIVVRQRRMRLDRKKHRHSFIQVDYHEDHFLRSLFLFFISYCLWSRYLSRLKYQFWYDLYLYFRLGTPKMIIINIEY